MSTKEKRASTLIMTPKFRLSYPKLLKAEPIMDNPTPYFTIQMLFDKKESQDWIKAAMKKVFTEQWGDKKIPSTFKNPWRDGDVKAEESENGAIYKGHMFCNAKAGEKDAILFLDGKLNKVNPDIFYAGCYCRAKIDVKTFTHKSGDGISFWLRALQLVGHGEPLSGAGALVSAEGFGEENVEVARPMDNDEF